MARRAAIAAAFAASLGAGGLARGAPKVGVVVLSHEGLAPAASDEVASELAVAVATQIEGEARSGASVRDKLANPPGDGCEDSPKCGRDTAAELEVDEALLLAMHLAGKTVIVDCYRVPRDPKKPPTQRTLRLLGGRPKRTQAILDLVAALYPVGSVTELAAPPPATAKLPPPAAHNTREARGASPVGEEEAAAQAAEPEEKPARARHAVAEPETPEQAKRKKKWLMYGLIAGGAAVVVAVAIILGVTLGGGGSPTGPAITLP